ncbi:MAG TPA: protease pro-enzyme activation domain-containing protein [Candidatus Binataceae bacterium]|nr:protease pro-enzyme activation domain-containing protein [Candidatus Binataceae bacterium]
MSRKFVGLNSARWLAAASLLFFLNAVAYASQSRYQQQEFPLQMARIPGHVLGVLPTAIKLAPSPDEPNQSLTLTIVLHHDDEQGFAEYFREVYDPDSENFGKFLTQEQIADRFGPTRARYESILRYLDNCDLRLIEGSTSRLTIEARGTRRQVEQTFIVHIGDYQLGGQRFYANDVDPSLPIDLASGVEAVIGLNNLPRPEHGSEQIPVAGLTGAGISASIGIDAVLTGSLALGGFAIALGFIILIATLLLILGLLLYSEGSLQTEAQLRANVDPPTPPPGSGQTVGLLEFDSFNQGDVSDYINLVSTAASLAGFSSPDINNLTKIDVDGGVPVGPGESEVLIDIDDVMTIAPGAKVTVYDAPFSGAGSFQSVLSQMIDDKVNIISNSWAYCEDQTTLADVTSIDTLVQQAGVAGISVFSGSGDNGSTCLDGSPNTVAVPADSPNLTAVGGSSMTVGPGLTYGSETWWNGSNSVPVTGQGGFGVSKFFSAPPYQSGFSGTKRSVPDVVTNADPAQGMLICQADNGGCPNGTLNGGTSMAAPSWAAYTAALNQKIGKELGFLNPQIYPLSNSGAFHIPASMGSDFAHVGLGSPSLGALYLQLTGQSSGAVSATVSQVGVYLAPGSIAPSGNGAPADGNTQEFVSVVLADANGFRVPGKTVSITPNNGSSAQISTIRAVTDSTNGSALFSVTDTVSESVTFTATDTTDNIQLTPSVTPTAIFVTPAAASAGLTALPSTVTADGKTAATITVTLQDSLGRPTPGKLIQISQTGGNSVISGSNPPVTNSNGMIQLTAVDSNNETITYSAIDVTDGNLPFPQTASVTFSNAPEPGCSNTFDAAPGFVAQPYATGFLAQNFCVGSICITGCPGAFGVAFDSNGNLYAVDQPTGDIYKFPPGGGVAGTSTLLTQTPLTTLDTVRIDSHDNLYGGLNATNTGSAFDYTKGAVVQIDTTSGNVTRTVASNLICPGIISIDPLSGDIFADDNCNGEGLNNSSMWRISNPGSVSPTTSLYTALPGSPNGTIAFSPNGTIYVPTTSGGIQLVEVSGTNGPSTPTQETLAVPNTFGLGLIAQGPQNAAAQFLISSFNLNGSVPGGIGTFDLSVTPPAQSSTLVTDNGQAIDMTIGPDGCVYAARGVAVFRITDTSGQCTYTAANPSPSLSLTPLTISPNPQQGTSQTFTATFHYTSIPDGTPVLLRVTGANPQTLQANTKSGVATFAYTAVHQGVDTLSAAATVGVSNVTSNNAVVTWASGTDVTFLNVNQSPTSGTQGVPVTVAANLVDVSSSPVAAVLDQQVNFMVGGATCSSATDSNGNATCQVTPTGDGVETLSAAFSASSPYNGSSASKGFTVLAAVSPTPTSTPTPTPSATPTPVMGTTEFSGSTADLSGTPGQQVSTSFEAVNNTGAAETIGSVTIALSHPGLFSGLSLSGAGESGQPSGAIGESNSFTFSPALMVAAGGSVTFTVTATIAGNAAMLGGPLKLAYANTLSPHPEDAMPLMLGLILLGVCLALIERDKRKRALIAMMSLGLLLAVAAAGCGGSSTPQPALAKSAITITGAQASGGDGAISGLPLQVAIVTRR